MKLQGKTEEAEIEIGSALGFKEKIGNLFGEQRSCASIIGPK